MAMKKDDSTKHVVDIKNYFQGANINNLVINGNMSKSGTETYHHSAADDAQVAYSDKQVAQALEAVCGEGKAINTKWKWAGAQWLLRFVANYPAKAQEFCDRIAELPFNGRLAIACEYNNIRKYSTLSFLNEDPRQMDKVRYSRNDETIFYQLRDVATALMTELRRLSLPTIADAV